MNPALPATSTWINRSDVKVWWNRADIGGASNILKGNLSPSLKTSFGPEYGFGWHQGWNDILNAFPANEYEASLTGVIRDLCAEFGQPKLPVSIGATGHNGAAATGNQLTVINAQLAVANPEKHPEFAGGVFTADTRPFWRASSVSPVGDTSHWNNNGETFFRIGKGMGDGMTGLLPPP